MKCGQHVGQLVEVVQVLERAIAAGVVEIAHIGRTIHGHEHAVPAAHLHGALGIARVQGEFGGRLSDEAHQQGAVDPHPRALDVGSRGLPHGDGFIVAEFAAHLLEDLERLLVDQLDRLVRHEVIDGDFAHQGGEGCHGGRPQRTAPLAPAAAPRAGR